MKNFKFFAYSLARKGTSSAYLFVAICLFLYSYTQVDLNLTLSQWSLWQVIQTSFQHVGWFQRPLSTLLYLLLLSLLSIFYFLLLWKIKKNKVTVKQFWQLVLPISFILLFSYNAFSYDLFNYMFDARIVTFHHQSPYAYKALDYPHDPWINFMRWTHRTYPYGIAWLVFTVPLSYIGMQFFLPTLFLFKALMVASYVGSVYFIGKILEKNSPPDKLFGMALFALNPLVLIESLVSAHNDIVMMFFVLTGIYALIRKKYFLTFVSFLISVHIKFIGASLPDMFNQVTPFIIASIVAGFWMLSKKRKEINWLRVFFTMGAVMVVAIILASQRTELQPWYLLWVLPFASLIPKKKFFIPLTIISLGLLLHYVPFLYTGNWDPPIPLIKFWLTTGSVVLGSLVGFLISVREK